MLKMFIICRKDLSNSQKTVQVTHACAGFIAEHALETQVQQWATVDKTLVLLAVPNEQELTNWEQKLKDNNLRFYTFVESYFNDAKTAICIEPLEDGSLFKELKLL